MRSWAALKALRATHALEKASMSHLGYRIYTIVSAHVYTSRVNPGVHVCHPVLPRNPLLDLSYDYVDLIGTVLN